MDKTKVDPKRRMLIKAGLILAGQALLGAVPKMTGSGDLSAEDKDWSQKEVDAFRNEISKAMVSTAGKPLWVLDRGGMEKMHQSLRESNICLPDGRSLNVYDYIRGEIGNPQIDQWADYVSGFANPALAHGSSKKDLAAALKKHPRAVALSILGGVTKSDFRATGWQDPVGYIIVDGDGFSGARKGNEGAKSEAMTELLGLIAPGAEVSTKLKSQIYGHAYLHESAHVGDKNFVGRYRDIEESYARNCEGQDPSEDRKELMVEITADTVAAVRLYEITKDTAPIEAVMHYRSLRTASKDETHHSTQFEIGRLLKKLKGSHALPYIDPDDVKVAWDNTKATIKKHKDIIWPDGKVPDAKNEKRAYFVGGVYKASKMGLFKSSSKDVKNMVRSIVSAVDYARNLSANVEKEYGLVDKTTQKAANKQQSRSPDQNKTLSRRNFLKARFPFPSV